MSRKMKVEMEKMGLEERSNGKVKNATNRNEGVNKNKIKKVKILNQALLILIQSITLLR